MDRFHNPKHSDQNLQRRAEQRATLPFGWCLWRILLLILPLCMLYEICLCVYHYTNILLRNFLRLTPPEST